MNHQNPILAGIDVHAIQQYVFRGSRLREIVGGSHLVDDFTAQVPSRVAEELGLRESTDGNVDTEGTWYPHRAAGGRIRAMFHDADQARAWIRGVTHSFCRDAPDLPFTAAIVEVVEANLSAAYTELHRHLESKRRSPGQESFFRGFPFTAPCRTTGDAAAGYGRRRNERLSAEMLAKQDAASKAGESLLQDIRKAVEGHTVLHDAMPDLGLDAPLRWPLDIEDMLPERDGHLGGYMGVIALDGNSIGGRIRKIFHDDRSATDHATGFKAFCTGLAACTRKAIVDSVVEVLFQLHRDPDLPRCGGKLPIRVLLEGGDDVTALIRPDLAIPFTRAFLSNFETSTGDSTQVGPLKAAAGVAIVKSKAPVLSGVNLATGLLKEAKREGRERSRASFYLASGGIPADLDRERSSSFQASDRSSLTAWPRTIDELEAFLARASFICRDLPRNQVRGAADECREGIGAAERAFAKMRDGLARNLDDRPDHVELVETLDRVWPGGWFEERNGRRSTDLLDCLALSRFLPQRSGAHS